MIYSLGISNFLEEIYSESESEVTQSCPTLCDPIDCSLPGSSVHGIFQARVLEWIAISFSRGSSQPRDWTQVSCIVDRRFTVWATREEIYSLSHSVVPSITLQWSLGKAFLSFCPILWNSAFKWVYLFFSPLSFISLLFSAICKASSDNHFAFLHFFLLEMVLVIAFWIMLWTSAHSSSSTLSDLIS